MVKNNKLLTILIVFFILAMVIPKVSLASSSLITDDIILLGTTTDPIKNPNYFDPKDSFSEEDANAAAEKVKPVLNLISTVGIVVSVITLMILGVKYMVGSVSEKAEYKKTMIPYIIGIVLLLSTSAIVGVIASLTQDVMQTQEPKSEIEVITEKVDKLINKK